MAKGVRAGASTNQESEGGCKIKMENVCSRERVKRENGERKRAKGEMEKRESRSESAIEEWGKFCGGGNYVDWVDWEVARVHFDSRPLQPPGLVNPRSVKLEILERPGAPSSPGLHDAVLPLPLPFPLHRRRRRRRRLRADYCRMHDGIFTGVGRIVKVTSNMASSAGHKNIEAHKTHTNVTTMWTCHR